MNDMKTSVGQANHIESTSIICGVVCDEVNLNVEKNRPILGGFSGRLNE